MFVASEKKMSSSLKLLLDKGADPLVCNDADSSPLHVAANLGNLEEVKLLLKAGAKVKVRDDRGETPLIDAVCKTDADIVKLLVKR